MGLNYIMTSLVYLIVVLLGSIGKKKISKKKIFNLTLQYLHSEKKVIIQEGFFFLFRF